MSSKTEIKGPYQDDEGKWCLVAITTTTSKITYRVDSKESAERIAATLGEDSTFGKAGK